MDCDAEASAGEVVRLASTPGEGRLPLADGRSLRLSGLDIETVRVPELSGTDAILLADAGLDRHGDLRGDLVVEGESLAERLVAAGAARVRPAPPDRACYATLLALEASARRAGLGLWAEPGYSIEDASDPAAVARLDGRFAIVEGRVRHVGIGRDQIWIDFGDVWREDVTLVVPGRDRARFEAAGLTPEILRGRRVRARGVVTIKDGPRIDLASPAALERIEERDPTESGRRR